MRSPRSEVRGPKSCAVSRVGQERTDSRHNFEVPTDRIFEPVIEGFDDDRVADRYFEDAGDGEKPRKVSQVEVMAGIDPQADARRIETRQTQTGSILRLRHRYRRPWHKARCKARPDLRRSIERRRSVRRRGP